MVMIIVLLLLIDNVYYYESNARMQCCILLVYFSFGRVPLLVKVIIKCKALLSDDSGQEMLLLFQTGEKHNIRMRPTSTLITVCADET